MMVMMRWEPLCCHVTKWQQHWVQKNLLSELSNYSSPLISANEVWGAGNKQSTLYLQMVAAGFPPPSWTYIQWTGFTIICDWKRRKKLIFYLPAIQYSHEGYMDCRQYLSILWEVNNISGTVGIQFGSETHHSFANIGMQQYFHPLQIFGKLETYFCCPCK